MPLSSELKVSYEAVLHDLEAEQADTHQQLVQYQNRLKELHHSILTLKKRLEVADPPSPTSTTLSRQPDRKYTYMSVRWAILDLLAESEAKTTAEIADALKAAGVQTKAANFANNVSAVLTTTMKEQPHDEVHQLPDGKWELTENGRRAIEHIRTTPKFLGALRNARSFARV
jgi:hypothetical protein